jgi:hypothetical protein
VEAGLIDNHQEKEQSFQQDCLRRVKLYFGREINLAILIKRFLSPIIFPSFFPVSPHFRIHFPRVV